MSMPLWVKLLVAGGLVLLAIAAVNAYNARLVAHGHAAGAAEERALWQAAEKERLEQEAAARVVLDKLREESDRETRRFMERAKEERAAAAAAADRMRAQLDAFVAAHRADPAPVADGPPAGSALDLLADLFVRVDARAGELADYADRARIAGQQCERDYDALRLQFTQQLSPPSPGPASTGSP